MISPEKFRVAKLALFNVRLLHDMHWSDDQGVRKLIEARQKKDKINEASSLMHQATFLQFAYITLVWLWEHAIKVEKTQDLAASVAGRFEFAKRCVIKGERKVEQPEHYLELIRNAISHGNVICGYELFVFSDRRKHKSKKGPAENAPTDLEIEWQYLGELAEAVLFTVSDSLYPPPPNIGKPANHDGKESGGEDA
jgi:hypothetical protein